MAVAAVQSSQVRCPSHLLLRKGSTCRKGVDGNLALQAGPGAPAEQRSGLASFSGGVGFATFSAGRAEPKCVTVMHATHMQPRSPGEQVWAVLFKWGVLCRQSAGAEGWQAKLRSYGLAGVVAYGLLNTLYYSCVFLVVWSSFKVPRGTNASSGLLSSARELAANTAVHHAWHDMPLYDRAWRGGGCQEGARGFWRDVGGQPAHEGEGPYIPTAM